MSQLSRLTSPKDHRHQGRQRHQVGRWAAKVGLSKEWVTAACLGQMTLDKAG